MEIASLAAGCFWGIEAHFKKVKGVTSTEVGYTGGHTDDPTYKQVCTGTTGHAEAVRLEFDPEIISYEEILNHFWQIHDPTEKNRQGLDIGDQYRSAIFFHSEEQKRIALNSKEAVSKNYSDPIVTEITEAGPFYRAEEYHQCYIDKKLGG